MRPSHAARRTADNLYWLARYVERAEYLARILEATQRLTALPLAYVGETNEWESAVATAGCADAFFAVHDEANEETVTDFLAFSTDNPSSIRNCFEVARTNARAVRTALTMEMWDAINSAWLELKRFGNQPTSREELARFLRWVQESSLRFDGSAYRTMLRNDAYWFSRLGVYIERADNTARILDVKYHLLLPAHEHVGGPLDYFQWAAILRSVSALTAYHWVYRESLKPWLIADLLILNEQMPRSLASCYENLVQNLDRIAGAYGRQGPAQRQARAIRTRLQNSRMEEIFQTGLHEFIGAFIADNNRLGSAHHAAISGLRSRSDGCRMRQVRCAIADHVGRAMRIQISHETVYRYEQPARGVIQTLRLTPRNHDGQYVESWRIDVSENCQLDQHEDAFGNITHVFTAEGPLSELRVLVEGEVETQDTDGVVRGAIERFPPSLYLRETPLTRLDPAIAEFAERVAATPAATR